MKVSIPDLEKKARALRREIIQTIYKAGSGHPGGSLSSIDLLLALYTTQLKVDPKNPRNPNRDRFILSKGHCSPAMYVILSEKGFFPKKELDGFRKINRLLQGHVDEKVPGVDFSAGSLAQGLSFGNGIALAAKLDRKDFRVYVMLGDGECEEGQVWEAAMTAAYYKLDNVTVILDKNLIQNDNFVKKTMDIDPIIDKWKAFGWETFEIDGHNFKDILAALDKARNVKGKPKIIVAHTIKGKGVSFMENNPEFHGKAPNEEEMKKALEELKD